MMLLCKKLKTWHKHVVFFIFFCMSMQKGRAKNLILFWIKENLVLNKWLYIILFAVCLISLIVGFVVGFGRAGDFSIYDLPDTTLVGFITKKTSSATLFFSRFFAFLSLMLLIYVFSSKVFLVWINFLIIVYQSFLLAINTAILISVYKLGGVISVLLVYFPLKFFLLVLLIVWTVVCFRFLISQKKCGISVFSSVFLKQNKTILILTIVLAFVVCVLEAILLPYVTSAVFIGIN